MLENCHHNLELKSRHFICYTQEMYYFIILSNYAVLYHLVEQMSLLETGVNCPRMDFLIIWVTFNEKSLNLNNEKGNICWVNKSFFILKER